MSVILLELLTHSVEISGFFCHSAVIQILREIDLGECRRFCHFGALNYVVFGKF